MGGMLHATLFLMELEFDTIYRPGFRTFFYLWGNYGWWLTGLFLLFGWLAMMLYWGPWRVPTTQYLASSGLAR